MVAGRRGADTRLAACMVLATTRADVNGVVRQPAGRAQGVVRRRWTHAVAETGMEYGGITPIGLPADWPVLVDAAVAATPYVVIGSGLRRSKLVVAGADLARLPDAEVLDLAT